GAIRAEPVLADMPGCRARSGWSTVRAPRARRVRLGRATAADRSGTEPAGPAVTGRAPRPDAAPAAAGLPDAAPADRPARAGPAARVARRAVPAARGFAGPGPAPGRGHPAARLPAGHRVPERRAALRAGPTAGPAGSCRYPAAIRKLGSSRSARRR